MVPTLQLLPAATHSAHHTGEISSCCFSPDGQFVLSGGWDGHLRLWDAANGLPVTSLRVGSKPVSACAIAPDATHWLSGNLDGFLSRWDAVTHRHLSSFLAHARPISAIVFGSDGHTLATASWDCKVGLWTLPQDQGGRAMGGHTDIVAGCRFTPDAKCVLSWSHDGTIRLWEVKRGRSVRTMNGHADRVTAAGVSPDGCWAASGSRDGMVKLWDLPNGQEAQTLNLGAEIKSCFFLLDGETLGTVEANGRLRMFSLPNLTLETELDTELGVECSDLAPSGNQLVLGGTDGRVNFIGLTGFEARPLLVTAVPTNRRTATPLQRLFGRSRVSRAFLCTCPACRKPFELADQLPEQPAPCPNCHRTLRIRSAAQNAVVPGSA
jgi:WD40 repeat protein